MAIITLTTDFGLKDHFVGSLKGAIYTALPEAIIVDISHDISPFNIEECAYILENSYKNFPKGSIHIIGIDSEATVENQHIAVYLDGHYFIGANNGVIGLIASEIKAEKSIEIQLPNQTEVAMQAMAIFAQVACHIARGGTLEVVGKPFKALKELTGFLPSVTDKGNKIVGSVIYIDNYGNIVTNIRKKFFEAYRKGRAFEINARTNKITQIHSTYSDIINFDLESSHRNGAGDLLALFNSSEYIELAIYKSDLKTVGGASSLLGIDYRDTITINFL